MKYDRMLVDIEVQADFFVPGGSCYSREHTSAAKNVYRLFDWARKEGIPVLSTLLRVRPRERGPLSPHPPCIAGTEGERKLPRTILPRSIDFGLRNTTDLPPDLYDQFQQVIIEKRDTDLFSHARAERLITELGDVTYILCGAGVAKGLQQAAVGLRSRNHSVVLAEDAILDLDDPLAEMARLRMDAKGVVFAPTSEIIAPRPEPKRRRPSLRQQFAHNHH